MYDKNDVSDKRLKVEKKDEPGYCLHKTKKALLRNNYEKALNLISSHFQELSESELYSLAELWHDLHKAKKALLKNNYGKALDLIKAHFQGSSDSELAEFAELCLKLEKRDPVLELTCYYYAIKNTSTSSESVRNYIDIIHNILPAELGEEEWSKFLTNPKVEHLIIELDVLLEMYGDILEDDHLMDIVRYFYYEPSLALPWLEKLVQRFSEHKKAIYIYISTLFSLEKFQEVKDFMTDKEHIIKMDKLLALSQGRWHYKTFSFEGKIVLCEWLFDRQANNKDFIKTFTPFSPYPKTIKEVDQTIEFLKKVRDATKDNKKEKKKEKLIQLLNVILHNIGKGHSWFDASLYLTQPTSIHLFLKAFEIEELSEVCFNELSNVLGELGINNEYMKQIEVNSKQRTLVSYILRKSFSTIDKFGFLSVVRMEIYELLMPIIHQAKLRQQQKDKTAPEINIDQEVSQTMNPLPPTPTFHIPVPTTPMIPISHPPSQADNQLGHQHTQFNNVLPYINPTGLEQNDTILMSNWTTTNIPPMQQVFNPWPPTAGQQQFGLLNTPLPIPQGPNDYDLTGTDFSPPPTPQFYPDEQSPNNIQPGNGHGR